MALSFIVEQPGFQFKVFNSLTEPQHRFFHTFDFKPLQSHV